MDQPSPCLLFASPEDFGGWQQRMLDEHLWRAFAQKPQLAIDVGRDAISLIDPASHAVIASAGLGQVTVKAQTYSPLDHTGEGVSKLFTQPVLCLQVPGIGDLRIAILPMRFSPWTGQQFRCAWRKAARARDVHEPALSPTHVVRDSEWINLVKQFGLGAFVSMNTPPEN